MLGSLFRREERAMQVTPWGDWSGGSRSATGINVTTDSALQLLTVYGCVSLIADTIATLPRDVFRNDANGNALEVSKPRWLEQPNPRTDIVEFITQVLSSLLIDGNAYVAYTIDQGFVVSSVAVLANAEVQIRVEQGTPVYFVKGMPFTGRLLHLKGVTRSGSLTGLSPIEAARQSIGLGLAAQEFAARFYSNGANLSGVIEVPGELTPEAAQILKQKWGQDHSGLARAHEPGVLTGGAAWKPMSVTPEQAQFLETRKFQSAEIAAQMFRVDPTLLGIPVDGKSLTYANLEQRGIHLVQFTLLPWIVRLERMFSFLLQPDYVKLNVAGLERADLLTRYQAYKVGIDGQFIKVNEAREKEELESLPDQLQVTGTDAETIGSLIRAGYEADSVIDAVTSGDLSRLKHTGRLPITVQSDDNNAPPASGGDQ